MTLKIEETNIYIHLDIHIHLFMDIYIYTHIHMFGERGFTLCLVCCFNSTRSKGLQNGGSSMTDSNGPPLMLLNSLANYFWPRSVFFFTVTWIQHQMQPFERKEFPSTHYSTMLFLAPSLQLARTSPAMLLGVRQPGQMRKIPWHITMTNPSTTKHSCTNRQCVPCLRKKVVQHTLHLTWFP